MSRRPVRSCLGETGVAGIKSRNAEDRLLRKSGFPFVCAPGKKEEGVDQVEDREGVKLDAVNRRDVGYEAFFPRGQSNEGQTSVAGLTKGDRPIAHATNREKQTERRERIERSTASVLCLTAHPKAGMNKRNKK